MAWVRARLCRLQKGCTGLAAAIDKAYQLLAQGRLFSPGTQVYSTTKTGRHDIAEILLKMALSTNKYICIIFRYCAIFTLEYIFQTTFKGVKYRLTSGNIHIVLRGH